MKKNHTQEKKSQLCNTVLKLCIYLSKKFEKKYTTIEHEHEHKHAFANIFKCNQFGDTYTHANKTTRAKFYYLKTKHKIKTKSQKHQHTHTICFYFNYRRQ